MEASISVVKPFTIKVKVIMSKNNNSAQVPRMLVDIVLQDVAMQISKQQYIAFCQLRDSLRRADVNRLLCISLYEFPSSMKIDQYFAKSSNYFPVKFWKKTIIHFGGRE